jgi:hypothetical protein
VQIVSNLHEIILEGESKLVALNTRIPHKLNANIDVAIGILQTTHNVLTFSKQSAVQILLMRGFESLSDDFEKGILGDSERLATIRKEPIRNASEGFEEVSKDSEPLAAKGITNK